MANLLKRLFNIRPDELAVFSLFFFFYFLIGIQFSIGLTVSEALFLSEVGPSFLPYMYIFNAGVIILISGVYSSWTDRLSISAMFKAVLASFAALLIGVRVLIAADVRAWAMPIAFPLLHTLFVVFTNMVPNNFRALYGLYLDVLQSKRLVPLILTGGRYGGILGGLSIPALIPLLGSVSNLLYVWLGAVVLSIAFIQYIEPRLRDRLLEGEGGPRKRIASRRRPKTGGGNLSLLRTNRYIAAFAAFSFLVVVLRSFQDFQYSVIFRQAFPTRAELASFLGYFTAVGSAVSLLIQTFVTPRLIRRLGLGTANLIYPLTTLSGFLGMTLAPGLYSAVLLRFNNKNLQESIRNVTNALLYNALPPSVRGRVGALIAGQVVAVASIVSGVFLILLKPNGLSLFPMSIRGLAAVSLLIALAYLIFGFALRREYGGALRKMLEERNLGLFRYAHEGFGPIDKGNLEILLKNVREGDDDLCVFAARMLAGSKSADVLDTILGEIERRKGRPAHELIRLLTDLESAREEERVRRLWAEALLSPEPDRRCAAMDAVEKAGLIEEMAEAIQQNLSHESPFVRARAIRLLVHSDDLFWLASGLHTLHAMLEEENPESRICALRCIGDLENPRFIRRLVPYLHQPDARVREVALDTAERLSGANGDSAKEMGEIVRVALADPMPAIRRRGVRLLGRRGTRVNFERLLLALSDVDEIVRREAVQSLKEIKRHGTLHLEGKGFLAFLLPWLLPAPGEGQAVMSAEEITDGLAEFGLRHLREVYEVVNHLAAIERRRNAGFTMLRKALEDKVHERTWLLLDLLGVLGDEKTVGTVSETLAHEATSSSRAIALETLSNVNAAGTTRQLILMLEPLLLSGNASEKIEEGRKVWDLHPIALDEVLRVYVDAHDPWVRAIAVDALGRQLSQRRDGRPARETEAWAKQIKALCLDEDPYVREASVNALGLIGNTANGLGPFLQAAANDADPRVQRQARRALARIKTASAASASRDAGEDEMLSTIEKALFLKSIKMFATMTVDQLKILSNISKEIHVPAGQVMFQEGDPCDYLYVLVEGEIAIVKDLGTPHERVLSVITPGTSFGEIALFGDEGRTAAARATKDCSLLGIEKDPLLLLIHEHPAISIAIIYQLAHIIRHQDEPNSDHDDEGKEPGPAASTPIVHRSR